MGIRAMTICSPIEISSPNAVRKTRLTIIFPYACRGYHFTFPRRGCVCVGYAVRDYVLKRLVECFVMRFSPALLRRWVHAFRYSADVDEGPPGLNENKG